MSGMAVFALWLPPSLLHRLLIGIDPKDWFKLTARPSHSLGALGIHTYALALLFLVLLSQARDGGAEQTPATQ